MAEGWDDEQRDMVEQTPSSNGGNGETHAPELRTLADAALLDRIRWMRQAGITFGGARDEYEILGYDRTITGNQYRDEYARGGIAGRVVDVFPNATWRGGFELVEDEDPERDTAFEQAWKALDTRLQVQAKLLRVDKLGNLSTFSVLLIGSKGDPDLSTELPRGRQPDDLIYLTPFSGGGGPSGSPHSRMQAMDADCSVFEFDVDASSPRFGLPLSYTLKRTDIMTPQLARPVHWSRILHVAENVLDDEVYGQPRLERVWNLLCDLRKVTGGGAEAFWLRANQGLQLDVSKDMSLPDAQNTIAALKEQTEAYKHQLDRWLRTRGVDVKVLGSDVANFSNPADAVLTQIAGALGIPKRILTGSEMGELASSQDRENWRDQVTGRQTGYAGPYIIRPLVDRLIAYGYLPKPQKGERAYEVRWSQMQVLTTQEKVEGAKGWAAVNAAQGSVVFTDEEIRDKWEGMAPLTDEQKAAIADAAEEKAKLAQAAPPAEEPATFPRAASAVEDEELVHVLAAAIESGATEVVEAICGVNRVAEFDPDQPRDDDGQWASGFGGLKPAGYGRKGQGSRSVTERTTASAIKASNKDGVTRYVVPTSKGPRIVTSKPTYGKYVEVIKDGVPTLIEHQPWDVEPVKRTPLPLEGT
ncbi:MAG: DUF1073 domain-containing protein [Sulfuricaulis sp.]|nr:DUF1073 domain-containing protein [Sulfuricaulis sp.]